MEKGRTPLVWIHRNALKKASMGLPAPKLAQIMTKFGKEDYRTSRNDPALSKTALLSRYADDPLSFKEGFIDAVRTAVTQYRDETKRKKNHLTAALSELKEAQAGDVPTPVILDGKTYRLSKTVVNPFHDRRVKHDWRYEHAEWQEGMVFHGALMHDCNKVFIYADTSIGQSVAQGSVYGKLIVPHLVLVDDFNAFMFELKDLHGSAGSAKAILQYMESTGRVTREQIREVASTLASRRGTLGE